MDGRLCPAGLTPSSRFEVRLERELAGVGSVEINKDHPKKNKQRLSTPSKAVRDPKAGGSGESYPE